MKKALAIVLALCLCAAGICAFADVRTFWSPEAVERCTSWKPTGRASNGFMHLINSGAAALDATGVCKDKDGTPRMKKWTDVTEKDIDAMLKATKFSPANRVSAAAEAWEAAKKRYTEKKIRPAQPRGAYP